MLKRIPHWLVRRRYFLLVLMTLLSAASAVLIPKVRINTDLTSFLPDDSSMKRGLSIVEADAPELYAEIRSMSTAFGDESSLLPKELPLAISLGMALLVVVLLIMCPSIVETPLILIVLGYAVVLNMGTNALLPSVSATTNSIAAVLQMVLSMDYCIIIVNRYRQEKERGLAAEEAMEGAISRASSAILSSAFTTLVSLLMLVFIKFKIGADLGVVLAKGVAFSLLCTFTVLPSLIIWADRALGRLRKKMPALPASPLARFEYRFRVPLTLLFVAAFVGAFFLQKHTRICYSSEWESEASAQRTGENPLMLIYATGEEAGLTALLDSLGKDPAVTMTASYPTVIGRKCTVSEMMDMVAMAGEDAFPEEVLRMVYYARAHPDRSAARLSLSEVEAAAQELADLGYVQQGAFDRDALMRRLMPAEVKKPVRKQPASPAPPSVPDGAETLPAAPDTLSARTDTLDAAAAPADSAAAKPSGRFTYEQAVTPISAAKMAELFEMDRMPVNTVYRMAGRNREKMSPKEFITYVRNNILTRRRYAALLPKGVEEQLLVVDRQLDSAVAAGPDSSFFVHARTDSLAVAVDSLALSDGLAQTGTVLHPVVEEEEEVVEPVAPPTPAERLAEMALSNRKYPAATVQKTLSAVGVDVSLGEMELLYLYVLSRRDYDESWTATPGEMLDFVADTLLADPTMARLLDEPVRHALDSAREALHSQGDLLRGEKHSAAIVMTTLELESEETFAFMDKAVRLADSTLSDDHYWIGESMMYKELKDGFPRELLLLTLLTVLSIFLIVALNFRSVLVPFPLVICVLTGVYVSVFGCGLGGKELNYVAYLVVQGILMGATIDYAILFTTYFRTSLRATGDKVGALETAYRGASHSILTSGLILSLVPFVMIFVLKDPMMEMILRSIGMGAFAVLLLVLFVLPGVLAATFRGKR